MLLDVVTWMKLAELDPERINTRRGVWYGPNEPDEDAIKNLEKLWKERPLLPPGKKKTS